MGYAALQVRSVGMAEETYSRSQAMSIAQDFIERVRVNVEELPTYITAANWNAPSAPAKTCVVSGSLPSTADACSATEMATQDIYDIYRATKTLLPASDVLLRSCNQVYCIIVAWDGTTTANCDQQSNSNGERGANAHCVVVDFMP